MKARRRHDLKQNALQAALANGWAFVKQRGSQIAWAALLIAVAVLGFVYVTGQIRGCSPAAVRSIETRFMRLRLLDENPHLARDSADADPQNLLKGFKELADQDTVERVAALSCVRAGDIYARQAFVAQVRTDREDLQAEARKYYRRAIDKFSGEVAAVARAHLGLAGLAESNGELDEARACYEAVLKLEGKAPQPLIEFARECRDKLDRLDLRPMATTAPSEPATRPASRPAGAQATTRRAPAKGPASTQPSAPAATKPAAKRPT